MFGIFIPSNIMFNGVRCVHIFGLPQIRPHKTYRSHLWRRSEFSLLQIFCFRFYYSPSSVLPFHIFLSVLFLLVFIFIYNLSSTSSPSSSSSPFSISPLWTQNEFPSTFQSRLQPATYNSPTLFLSLVFLSSLPTTIYRHSVSPTDPLMVCNSDLEKSLLCSQCFIACVNLQFRPRLCTWRLLKNCSLLCWRGDRGSSVVKVLCYKSEGRWFDPSWCQWKLPLT